MEVQFAIPIANKKLISKILIKLDNRMMNKIKYT
ncbi:Uncharacterised protein [[Pasteurella] mairii]|uniref:Uncharacterized protein n=1 Tax=[Pasteurella] mairii TaxID=757 RepID=A0A379B5S4_9PAST|nr:Uncharacterised protein [[Pasteurella] mairii]